MDKEWVFLDHDSDEYKEGLQAFINRSLQFSSFSNKISCPCSKCRNRWPMLVQEVEDHIYVDGFDPDYVNLPWVEHGEQLPELPALNVARPFEPHQPISVGDIPDMLQDAFGLHDNEHVPDIEVEDLANHDSIPTPDAAKFYKLMSEADMELFPGARKKKIDFLIRYYQLKVLHGWSDVSFTESLKLLKESFPEGENLPDSFYKTKQLVKDLGLSYEKIDACPKDCMLYWKEHSEATSCCICGTSRYIKGAAEDGTSAKKIAAKVLRYFPLGPRLQRLYMSRHTAESMIWHSTKRPRDGFLRHPADSLAWSKVDELYPNFGNESRNVRLGLASDGFNPFGNMSTSHSTWPVVMSVYNLPPWMCMKQPYMMLSLLIPGPKGPGNDIDVYLQPLVEELKNLWNEGIHTYDAFTKSTFTMRAAVLWTISDFPAYAMLSGYSTKGYKACPVCMEETDSIRLHHGNKECFMGHRRCYPIDVKSFAEFKKWDNHDRMWERVKGTIDWSVPETLSKQHKIRKYVVDRINDRWRQHKHQLKKKFWEPHQDSPVRFLCSEHGVDDGQWVKFVDNLDRVEMKEKAAINVNNRKQKKISHTTGTLTYAAKIYQWQVENNKDAPPNRKERFKITHLKKGSKTQYIDEASTQAVLSLEQKEAEKRNQNIDITLEVVEDIYAEVFGVEKRNRVRGMETGYTWSDVPFIHTEKRGVSKEVEALRAAVEEQKRVSERASMEVERLRSEAARERNEVAEREKQREAELEKIKDEQKQMMEKMKKMEENMQISFATKMADMMKGAAGDNTHFLNFFQQISQVSSSQGETSMPQMQSALPDEALDIRMQDASREMQ